MRLIGIEENKIKAAKNQEQELECNDTLSEVLSDISKISSEKEADHGEKLSQESFGLTSQISSSNNLPINIGSLPEIESSPNGGADTPDIGKGWKAPTQEGIHELFDRVKRQAQKI